MSVFHAVLWLTLGALTLAGLWVAHQAEVRVARLRADRPGWRQPASTPGQQAEWDEHVTTALDVIRAAGTGRDRIPQDDDDLMDALLREALSETVEEIAGRAAGTAAANRALEQHKAAKRGSTA